MKIHNIILTAIFVGLSFSSCSEKEDTLKPSKETIFPDLEKTIYDTQLENMFSQYNTRVEYRYIKNLLPNDWYNITPIKESLIIPMSEFLIDYFVTPLEISSNKELVIKTFPKKIVYVGSPAYKKDGSRVLGQAEGGTLIRFTECNDFNLNDKTWIRTTLRTAYHEYCHILHQKFILPDEYRNITPDSYTRSGWRAVSQNDAIRLGMVSPYATNNVSEDFVELYSFFITATQEDVNYVFNDEAITGITNPSVILAISKRNEGREFIRKKFLILKKFLTDIDIDINKTREELQNKIN